MNNIFISLTLFTLVAALGLTFQFRHPKSFLSKIRLNHAQKRRVLVEDTLKYIYNCEQRNESVLPEGVAGMLQISVADGARLMSEMVKHNLLTMEGTHWQLTDTGRDYAVHIIRAHRLWERYLADKTGFPETEWHAKSEKAEHQLTPEDTVALEAALGHPRFDPHGDPIPTKTGALPNITPQLLTTFPIGQQGKIIHLEDEPEQIYNELIALGIHLGATIKILTRKPLMLKLMIDNHEIELSPIQAANISVLPVEGEDDATVERAEPLSNLRPGEMGRVIGISHASRGPERRRLMDLGIVPGTIIKAEMISPSGDPTAYLVRGALIALRREQAATINISRTLEPHKKEDELEKSI